MKKSADMAYHMGLVLSIYPSYAQQHIVAVNDGARRAVYNHLVACGNEIYRLSKTAAFVPSDRQRLDYLRSVSQTTRGIKNALPFLYSKDVDAMTIDNAKLAYAAAWKNVKEQHRGIPTFKKKAYAQSYQTNAHYYKNGGSNVRFDGKHHIILPKLGRIRFAGSKKMVRFLRAHADTIRIATITIRRLADGAYTASLALASDMPFKKPFPKTGKQVGLDLNLIEEAVSSDERTIKNIRPYQSAKAQLAQLQRRMCRMREAAKRDGRDFRQSKNYQALRQKAAHLQIHVARQRSDYLHIFTANEVKNHDLIAAEDLKVKNLLKNHKLALAIADASWGTLLSMLAYKAKLYGKTFVKVPPQYTSQTCSHCGYVLEKHEALTLADREWTCPKCGTHHDRDVNAARNILKKALSPAGA